MPGFAIVRFEQMKGRGTRTLDEDDLKKVTPSATSAKTHYVIVDAVGVTRSLKTASEPLIAERSLSTKDLATGVMMGARDENTVSSLAGRLARLDRQLKDDEKERIKAKAGGKSLTTIVGGLIGAIDPDKVEAKAKDLAGGEEPDEAQREEAQRTLVDQATNVFTGPLIELIDTIRRDREQTIDHDTLDEVLDAGWDGDAQENARALTQDFEAYLAEHRDQIEALSLFYGTPARRAEITFRMIRDLISVSRRSMIGEQRSKSGSALVARAKGRKSHESRRSQSQ